MAISARVWESWPEDRPLVELSKDALDMERRIQKGVNLDKERTRYTQICTRIESLAMMLATDKKATCHIHWPGASDYDRRASSYLHLIETFQRQSAHDAAANLYDYDYHTIFARLTRLCRAFGSSWKEVCSFTSEYTHEKNLARRRLAAAYRDIWRKDMLGNSMWAALNIRRYPFGKSFYPPGPAVEEQAGLFSHFALQPVNHLIPNMTWGEASHYETVLCEKADLYAEAVNYRLAVVEIVTMTNLHALTHIMQHK